MTARAGDTIAYSDFLSKVDDGSVKDVVIADNNDYRQDRQRSELPHHFAG